MQTLSIRRNRYGNLFACPQCRGHLLEVGNDLNCNKCRKVYPIQQGVIGFEDSDAFYDEYSVGHALHKANPGGLKEIILRFLPFWSWREWKFWNHVIPQCDRILDIGCGPGSQIFRERAKQVVGVDASATILRDCAKRYDVVAVARLPHLPFPSASMDAAVTSHVMGHIPFEVKEAAIAEIARVVRKGGVTAHVIETASNHPAVLAAKKKPALFQKQFIDQHGHVGLEPVDEVIARFERHGFRLTERRLVDAIVPSALNYKIFFDVDGYRDLPEIQTTAALNAINKNALGNGLYEVGMGIFHRTFEQWFGRPDQAQFVMVAFERV